MGGILIVDECTLAVMGSLRVIAFNLSTSFPLTKTSKLVSCNSKTNFPLVLKRPTPLSFVRLWLTDCNGASKIVLLPVDL